MPVPIAQSLLLPESRLSRSAYASGRIVPVPIRPPRIVPVPIRPAPSRSAPIRPCACPEPPSSRIRLRQNRACPDPPPSSRIRLRQNRACPDPPARDPPPAESCLSRSGRPDPVPIPTIRRQSAPIRRKRPPTTPRGQQRLRATRHSARRAQNRACPNSLRFGEARAESCLSQFAPSSRPVRGPRRIVPVPVRGQSQFAATRHSVRRAQNRACPSSRLSSRHAPCKRPPTTPRGKQRLRATRHSARRAQNRARRAPNRACPSSRSQNRACPSSRSVPVRGPSSRSWRPVPVRGPRASACPGLRVRVPRLPVYASRFARHLRSWFAPGPPALAGCRRAAKPAGVTGLKFPHTVPIGRFAT